MFLFAGCTMMMIGELVIGIVAFVLFGFRGGFFQGSDSWSFFSVPLMIISALALISLLVVGVVLYAARASWKNASTKKMDDVSTIGFQNSPSQPPGTVPVDKGIAPTLFSRTNLLQT